MGQIQGHSITYRIAVGAQQGKGLCLANPYNFEGDREAVRMQAIKQALNNLLELLVCD